MKRQDYIVAVAFIAPLIILLLAVTFLPIINAMWWSMNSTYYTKTVEFIVNVNENLSQVLTNI